MVMFMGWAYYMYMDNVIIMRGILHIVQCTLYTVQIHFYIVQSKHRTI